MKFSKIQSVQFSLLKRKTDTDKNSKAEYLKKKTAKFTLPSDFPRNKRYFYALTEDMYNDLMQDAPEDINSLGIWVQYGDTLLENAISLNTLIDIKKYSKDDINPIFEFFKMTLPK
jgi:hypothetical protein